MADGGNMATGRWPSYLARWPTYLRCGYNNGLRHLRHLQTTADLRRSIQCCGSRRISSIKRQAMALGALMPCSQDRTVLAETPTNFAKRVWLAFKSVRVSLTCSGP